MKIPFVGPAYRTRSMNAASDLCINLYPEVSEVDGNVRALYGTPGTRKLLTLPNTGGCRGAHVPATGRAIIVQGDRVYRIDGNWNYQQCPGQLLTATGPVCIADNGTTAVIVDGNNGYTLDLASSVITRIISDGFYGADRVAFFNGLFVFNKPDTQQFYWTGLYNTTTDALDFASAEGSPDLLVSLIVDHSECWMFGTVSTEVFYYSGNADQPIERIQGAFIEHGCAAPQSVAKLDNTVFWVGRDSNGQGTVWRANGYTPQRISTHAIEYALQSYSQISDAIAYTYQQDGHAFYVLTFPQANKTWCYDAATGAWHERSYRNTATGNDERHRSNCLIYFGGQHVVGDYADGRVYALDPDYYTDDGDPLVSVRTCPVVSNSPNRLFHQCLTIEVEEGVGLQGIVPVPEYNASAQLYFDALESAGITPTTEQKSVYNAIITQLKAGTLWDKLFDIQLYANYTVEAASVGLKQLVTGNIYDTGFTALTGVTVTNAVAGSFEYTIESVDPNDDFFLGVGVTGVSGNGPIVYADQTTPNDCRIAIEKVTGSFEAAVQCDPANQFDCGTTLGRDTVIVRESTISSKAYKDGALVASDAGASVGYGNNVVNMGSFAGAAFDITATYLWAASGTALTAAEAAELSAIIDNYLDALS